MKIVAISDLHADAETLGVSRRSEVEAALWQAAKFAMARSESDAIRDVEGEVFFLCLGDVADPDSGGRTTRAQELVVEVAIALAESNVPSVWLAGNHDVHDDGSGATTLGPLAAVAKSNEWITVAENPGFFALVRDVGLLALPYAPLARTYDPAEFVSRWWPKCEGRVVVASHLMVPGIQPGEETLDMPRGRDVVFPLAETRRAVARLQGHYHRRQVFDPRDGGAPIHVVGSPARLTFGEQDHEPGFLVVDVPDAP